MHKQAVRISEKYPDRRDVFLCHAWDDRRGAAKELHDELEKQNVSVWFSEKDVVLGKSLIREIDKGLRTSKIGIVLVTPSMFKSLDVEGIADKELSALLATDRVIPVTHETTFEELRDVSPLLAARSGLSTEASSLEEVAIKIAETIDSDSDF
ncbi:toll/interleukin-1 receptor domain-containing protein [Arthrobacter sp. JUb115]|uniref:toll/interleukin-1 receptor domain-containing protein n=1 Tax=Arthrobacter sp. JUb115 TaxID=2485108 RepID=UPI002570EE69|nr:toll/interleukin-1 receptor domain-containing protein [Arthrobacter sp. JUb115]